MGQVVPYRLSLLCGLRSGTSGFNVIIVLGIGKGEACFPSSGGYKGEINRERECASGETFTTASETIQDTPWYLGLSLTLTKPAVQLFGENNAHTEFIEPLTGNEERSSVAASPLHPVKRDSITCLGHSAGTFTNVWKDFILSVQTSTLLVIEKGVLIYTAKLL